MSVFICEYERVCVCVCGCVFMPVNMCVPGQVYGAVSVVFGLSAVRTMEAHSLSSADLRWMTAVSPARRSVPQGAFPPFRQLICHLLYEVIAIRMKQARGHRDGERERARERERERGGAGDDDLGSRGCSCHGPSRTLRREPGC